MKIFIGVLSLTLGLLVFSCQNPLADARGSAGISRTLPAVGQSLSLKANVNGYFASADQNLANTQVVANRQSAGSWETFQVVDAGNGMIALKASNGLYVCADLNIAANAPLVANRATIGTWETFQCIDLGSGIINLKAMATGKFVSADQNLGSNLVADRAAAGAWESFTWATIGDSTPAPSSSPTASPSPLPTVTPTASPDGGDVIGKITVGYQAWFSASGDGSPINGWWHWSQNWSQTASIAQNTIHAWPDMREYTASYLTAYPNLGNGQAARLFSSFDQSTINVQVSWMKQYGIDTAALQRFNPTGGEGPIRDAITAKVRTAAENYGVKFYIMYDVTDWTNMQNEIKADWSNKMSAYISSPAYARQNGKPVVCIWGFGFNDNNHPWDAASCLDVVNWFKAQGCYIIGGVPREWRTGTGGSRPGYSAVYHAFNMLSPWMVGAIGNLNEADNHYNNELVPDQADCNATGVAYQPCVLPGDNGQRAHGDFMWRQFYNTVRVGAQGIYISMFDEYNEGNQIAKTAEDASMSPSGTSAIFFTLDQDGVHCSSDYYLRLTGDGGKMLKKQIALTATKPTSPQ